MKNKERKERQKKNWVKKPCITENCESKMYEEDVRTKIIRRKRRSIMSLTMSYKEKQLRQGRVDENKSTMS